MLPDTLIQFSDYLMSGTAIVSSALSGYLFWSREKIRKDAENGAAFLQHLDEGFYRSTLDGKMLRANPALVRLNGYRTEQELLSSVQDIAAEWYVDPGRRSEFQALLFRNGEVRKFVSEIYRHKTRERIWVSENARLVCDQVTGEPLYYEGTVMDISDEVRVAALQDRLTKLASNLPGGLFQLVMHPDGSYSVPYVSDAFVRLFDLEPDEPIGNPNRLLKRIHPDDLDGYLEALQDSSRTLEPINHQFRVLDANREIRWLHLTATPEPHEETGVIWHGHVNDITERKQQDLRVEQLAYYDSLTGLPKRSVMDDKLIATISACNRRGDYAALLFLDLDGFKSLNDQQGHDVGDQLLKQVANRLRKLMRVSDMVSRFAGDEFVVLIDNLGETMEAARDKAKVFAGKVRSAFEAAFDLESGQHFTSASIGIALIDPNLPTPEEIIRRADTAMYQAKKNGRNTFFFFEPDDRRASEIEMMYRDIGGAAARGEFVLFLQSQVDSGGRIVGSEAFVRWNHPTRGLLAPSEFVSIAERNGAINEINDWVIGEAIDILAEWKRDPLLNTIGIAINVGPQHFLSPKFSTDLETRLFVAGIDRSLLTLEISESSIMRNPAQIGRKMLEMKDSGIRFSLDDFGTGAASLSNLNQLPLDEIKIDGAFVSSLESEARNRSMIEGMLGVAKAMGLETVAEHVGSEPQEKYLRQHGCTRFQGFFYHPPVHRAAFEELVRSSQAQKRLAAIA